LNRIEKKNIQIAENESQSSQLQSVPEEAEVVRMEEEEDKISLLSHAIFQDMKF
jgi:hypothetical protein